MAKTDLRKTQRKILKANILKLQKAGLIGEVDFRKKATPATIRKLEKYRAVLVGKAAAVQAPDLATARRLRKTLGLKGSGKTIIVPREKGERYRVEKSTGDIVSTRKGYGEGEIIHKRLSKNFPVEPRPESDKRYYYTIPEKTPGAAKLKRTTFGSQNELLFYLSKYGVSFEDMQDYLEVEQIRRGGRADKRRQKTIYEERQKAKRRFKRRKPKKRKR
jgi:hypothetical protein